MINVAVCDDELGFLEELAGRVSAVLSELRVQFALKKYTTGRELLSAGPFDVVFLDVELKGDNGIGVARALRDRGDECRLVFVTAHRKYVFAGYDVEATHYLLKPVDDAKLKEVLERIVDKLSAQGGRYLLIKQGAHFCKLKLSGILYIEVMDRKVFAHSRDGVYDFYEKLENIEKQLPESFFRCHRSFIVNFEHVEGYGRFEIAMEGGQSVPIAKRKYSAFAGAFLNFLKQEDGLL